MVSVEKVSLNFGGFDLFKEISFLINSRDRIGLTGKNGAGKTTLLRIIAGIDQPSSGKISLPKELTIGYLPQQMAVTDTQTLLEETEKAFESLLTLKAEIEILNNQISHRSDFHSQSYIKLLDIVHEKSDHLHMLGGDDYKAEMEQTLVGLGFERSDFGRKTAEFSGGWRMRIEIAKLLLRKPDLFLLDEPTNHLDIEAIQWLEDFLKNYRGAVVLVSHDKAFLDNITSRTIEISMGKISDQRMNYSSFITWKKEQREHQLAAYRNQQKTIGDTERFIERFRYKATKAVQVQSRTKALEKIDRIEIEEEDNATLNIKFPPAPRSGSVVVEGLSLSKNYGDLLVLDDIDLVIERGEKIAFVGRNGEGKTTLARMLMREIAFSGSLKIGYNVRIGYFAQDQAERLNPNYTVLETIDRIAVGDIRTKIRDLLGAFLFSGEDVDKKVSVLSGGERSRLAMIGLLLEPVNFLVLDEPTNHLDMRSKEILKNALTGFDGTILLVSHDREFLDGLVTCVYEFRNKKIRQHLGGIYEFLEKKKIASLKELETRTIRTDVRNDPKKSPQRGVLSNSGQVQDDASGTKPELSLVPDDPQSVNTDFSDSTVSYEEKKNINRNISRLEKNIAVTEEKIMKLELEIAEMDDLLSDSTRITSEEIFLNYEKSKNDLSTLMHQWEKEHLELEAWTIKKTW
jgi:ATP-binding cassette, subfamily F, member 3